MQRQEQQETAEKGLLKSKLQNAVATKVWPLARDNVFLKGLLQRFLRDENIYCLDETDHIPYVMLVQWLEKEELSAFFTSNLQQDSAVTRLLTEWQKIAESNPATEEKIQENKATNRTWFASQHNLHAELYGMIFDSVNKKEDLCALRASCIQFRDWLPQNGDHLQRANAKIARDYGKEPKRASPLPLETSLFACLSATMIATPNICREREDLFSTWRATKNKRTPTQYIDVRHSGDGSLIKRLPTNAEYTIEDLQGLDNGNFLSLSDDKMLRFWNVTTETSVTLGIDYQWNSIHILTPEPDEVIALLDDVIYYWDAATGNCLRKIKLKQMADCSAWLNKKLDMKNGELIVIGYDRATLAIMLLNVSTKKSKCCYVMEDFLQYPMDFRLSDDGNDIIFKIVFLNHRRITVPHVAITGIEKKMAVNVQGNSEAREIRGLSLAKWDARSAQHRLPNGYVIRVHSSMLILVDAETGANKNVIPIACSGERIKVTSVSCLANGNVLYAYEKKQENETRCYLGRLQFPLLTLKKRVELAHRPSSFSLRK